MSVDKATGVGPAKLEIAYERFGDPAAPPVLLIMGFGAQMIGWPDGLVDALVSRGLHVIRFDNRDVGLSTHLTDARVPNLFAALTGDTSSASYTLVDLAADTAGLLDALGIASAHLVGSSMGGFIAQTVAIEHPTRVRSLTSIMSSTGDRRVGQPSPEALAMMAGPVPSTRDAVVERALRAFRMLGSPGFPRDEAALVDRAGRSFDRAYDPLGLARQAMCVLASPDRTPGLRGLRVPTLVIHGSHDRMCDVSGGHATAAAVPGAELVVIEGMGHDLPAALWPDFAARIAALVARAERLVGH